MSRLPPTAAGMGTGRSEARQVQLSHREKRVVKTRSVLPQNSVRQAPLKLE